jgi:hypothetical protein
MAFAMGLQQGAAAAAATSSTAAAAGAGAQQGLAPEPELCAFGSLLPDDAEVGHAVEAALAAVEPSNGVSASSKVEAAVREALSTAAASAGPAGQGVPRGVQQLWRGFEGTICNLQFATGLAAGLAIAAAVWRCR